MFARENRTVSWDATVMGGRDFHFSANRKKCDCWTLAITEKKLVQVIHFLSPGLGGTVWSATGFLIPLPESLFFFTVAPHLIYKSYGQRLADVCIQKQRHARTHAPPPPPHIPFCTVPHPHPHPHHLHQVQCNWACGCLCGVKLRYTRGHWHLHSSPDLFYSFFMTQSVTIRKNAVDNR